MSRWTETFQNHPFRSVWANIVEASKVLSLPDETIATQVEELARFKKVISYIDSLIEAADPELIPVSTWNNFLDQATQCLLQINEFNSNKTIKHLSNANNHLDNVIAYVRPYVVSDSDAAKAASKAFKEYSNTVRDKIDELRSKTQSAISEIAADAKSANELKSQIDTINQEIARFEIELLKGSDTEKSLKDKVVDVFNSATISSDIISEYQKKLTAGNEQEASIILQIQQAKEKAEAYAKYTTDNFSSSKKVLEELDGFHKKIFGEIKADDDETPEAGLASEIQLRIQELDDFKKEQIKTYQALLAEIETLLPGAMSVGLSSAYADLKKSFDAPIRNYSSIFYFSLTGIVVIGFILVVHSVSLTSIQFVDMNDPLSLFGSFVYKLPIFGSLLWLAIFASKRRSEDRRLQQEYAHKEALAKSYYSFKQQIDALSSGSEDLSQKLLDKTIEALALNASSTLDGKHGDKIPAVELTEKAIDKFADIIRAAKGN